MGHSQGASLAGTVMRLLLPSMGREPRELITRGQNPVNGDMALLAHFPLQHSAEPSLTVQLGSDLWVTRDSHILPRGMTGQSGSGSCLMSGSKN